MAPKCKLSAKQKALFELLKKKSGAELEQASILEATGWKPTAWRVYCNNGLYASFLRETKPGVFLVTFRHDTSEQDFRRQVSQSKRLDDFEKPLAQALARRSAENFVLAMEVYNRPSLTNRLDAFALLFTTAWEQILKAEIVEKNGEQAIFKPLKPGHRRESIGIATCLEKLFRNDRDPVRLNIERIAELRHTAAHLVMPELQPVYSRVFQAGVFNYARWYQDKLGKSFSSHDLQAVLFREGWKRCDNEFHRLQRNPNTAKFSHEAADTIVRNVLGDPGYLQLARGSYNAHLRKTQGKKPNKQ